MRSAGAPTATVLTVVTMVFAPVLKHGQSSQQLVGKDTTTVVVSCSNDYVKCPKQARMHEHENATDSSRPAVDAAVSQGVADGIADFQAEHPSDGGFRANHEHGEDH